ncbi:glycosyltransferase family 4 protein [Sphingomonas sp. MMS24-JH45]
MTTNEFMSEMMIRGGISSDRIECIPTLPTWSHFSPAVRPIRLTCSTSVSWTNRRAFTCSSRRWQTSGRMGDATPTLRIAGSGHTQAYVDALHARVGEAGMHRHVQFLGAVAADKIPTLFRHALCSLMPALWYENLPNSVVESLASGCPVISSDIGSLSRTVTDEINGLLHPPGDVTAIAHAMHRLVVDSTLRGALAVNARITASARRA